MKTLIFHMTNESNKSLSYQHGWINAFRQDKRFKLTEINLAIFDNKLKKIKNFYKIKNFFLRKYDLIIFLHSSFSNGNHIPKFIIDLISIKSSYKVFFVGNEYKLMPEKLKFCKKVNLNLFVTQSLDPDIINLYRDELKCEVMGIPGGGLNTDIFFPTKDFSERPIDIGLRTYDEPVYFGHQERRLIMNETIKISKNKNINLDVSMEEKDRFSGNEWAKFLNNCKSLIGTNTGYDYFDLEDKTRIEANKLDLKFNGNFEKIFNEYFKNLKKKHSMRIISGKSIEAAGCKTLQVLVEGDYGGYLQPNILYISVKKDLRNLDECIEMINDENFCKSIIDNAYDISIKKLTYINHLDKFFNFINIEN